MTVKQTPEGKWYFRFQYKGLDCCEGGFRTKEQARDAEIRATDRAINHEIHPDRVGDGMTYGEAAELFFEKNGRHKRSGRTERYMNRLLAGQFGRRHLREIMPEHVESAANVLQRRRGFNDHTWNHYIAAVKVVFNYLRKKRLYGRENPANAVDTKKIPRARVRFLYPNEEKLLTPAIAKDARLWPYYFVALHTGMRRGELARIRVSDISLQLRHVFVPYAKNGKSRYVPISEGLAKFLEAYMRGKNDSAALLPGQSGPHTGRCFTRLCKEIGLSDFRFHDLRHTFAANLLAKGEPIYKVSKILGHSSVLVTEQHYGHLSMADLKASVDRIDGVVSGLVAIESQWKPCVAESSK